MFRATGDRRAAKLLTSAALATAVILPGSAASPASAQTAGLATGTQIKASPGATFGVNFTPARKRGKIFAFFEYKRVQENITYKPITKFRKGKLFVGSSPYFNEMTRLSKGKAKMKLTRYRWVKGKWGRWKEPRKAVIKLRHRNTGRYLRLVFKDNNGNGKWRSNLYWDGPQGGFPLT